MKEKKTLTNFKRKEKENSRAEKNRNFHRPEEIRNRDIERGGERETQIERGGEKEREWEIMRERGGERYKLKKILYKFQNTG